MSPLPVCDRPTLTVDGNVRIVWIEYHTEVARASMSSSILYSSIELSFSIFFHRPCFSAVPVYSNTSTAVRSMYEYGVVEPRAQHSTAQHSTAESPLQKAANQVRADQSTSEKKYVRTCMLRPVCFPGAWSFWHLQVACLHLKCWTIYLLHLSVIPILFFLVSEGSGRDHPLREVPCIIYHKCT